MINLAIICVISFLLSNNVYSQASLFDGLDEFYDDRYLIDEVEKADSDDYEIIYADLPVEQNNTSLNYVRNSSLPDYRSTDGRKIIVISIANQRFGAYDSNGYLVKSGRVSTAKRGYHTKRGTFSHLQKRGGPNCWSKKYQARMPYCMFYSGGFALHGYHDVPNYPASHGCIRMLIEDAKWLHNIFVDSSTLLIVR